MGWKKPIKPLNALICTLVIIWILAFLFAAPYLAAWYNGTKTPSRDEVKLAKVVIALPFTVPLGLFLLWCWWHQRRDDKAMRRRKLHAPKLTDPTHELRLADKPSD